MELKAEEISQIIKEQIKDYDKQVELSETGVVLSVGDGIARADGLAGAMAMELLEFPPKPGRDSEDFRGKTVPGHDTNIAVVQ